MANSPPVFSEQETAWHRTAQFQFVPWVARLLGNGPLRGNPDPLPAGNPDGLTEETVDAIRDMMYRAVWKFLARDCGWRQQYAVSFSTHGGEGTFSRRRLWESASGNRLPALRFTADAIDLLVSVHNSNLNEVRVQDLNPPGCSESNGDLFLHHLIFRRLTTSSQTLQGEPVYCRRRWLANPLNALFDVTGFQDPKTTRPDWDRITDPDVAAFFPWIGARIAEDWRSRGREIWSGNESPAEWFGNLAGLLHELIESAAGRPDLLTFLLAHFLTHADSAEDDLKHFESVAKTLNRQEREQIAIPWSAFLKSADELRSVHRACRALHPAERSEPDNCFLAAWQEVTFSETADRLKALRHRVRPSIS